MPFSSFFSTTSIPIDATSSPAARASAVIQIAARRRPVAVRALPLMTFPLPGEGAPEAAESIPAGGPHHRGPRSESVGEGRAPRGQPQGEVPRAPHAQDGLREKPRGGEALVESGLEEARPCRSLDPDAAPGSAAAQPAPDAPRARDRNSQVPP